MTTSMGQIEQSRSGALPVNTAGNVQLRYATARDAWHICQIECACFGWERLLFGLWQRIFSTANQVWVADVDGRIAGYLIAYARPLDELDAIYIGGVGVLPALRRCGLGSRLTQSVLVEHQPVWLHVRVSNAAAIGMYQRLGMQVYRRLNHFYTNDEDAFIMATAVLMTAAPHVATEPDL
jgi:ribosomal protein S18 acetylase RimI-like enzyme